MKYRVLYIIVSVVTAGLYLTMTIWTMPEIAAEADGLMPFDLRPFGYSPEEAETFLNALSEEGRVFYAEVQHVLDTFFPAFLLIWAGWTVWLLFPGPLSWGLMALAAVGCVADYSENAAVAQLLAKFDPNVAVQAARWTIVKSVAASVVYLAIIWALVRWAWARFRR